MKPFVPPKPIPMERYDQYFWRFLQDMAEHYNEFLKELQNEQELR